MVMNMPDRAETYHQSSLTPLASAVATRTPSLDSPMTSVTKRIVVTILVDVDDGPNDGAGSEQPPKPADEIPDYLAVPAPLPPRQTIRRLRNATRSAGPRISVSTGRDLAMTGPSTRRRALALAATAIVVLAALVWFSSFQHSMPTSASPPVTTAITASAAGSCRDTAAAPSESDQANNGGPDTLPFVAWWDSMMQQPSTVSQETSTTPLADSQCPA
jgi:hypothetical protein